MESFPPKNTSVHLVDEQIGCCEEVGGT